MTIMKKSNCRTIEIKSSTTDGSASVDIPDAFHITNFRNMAHYFSKRVFGSRAHCNTSKEAIGPISLRTSLLTPFAIHQLAQLLCLMLQRHKCPVPLFHEEQQLLLQLHFHEAPVLILVRKVPMRSQNI